MIEWIVRMFTEALQWEHGVQFVCVAFQNRVAFKMGGSTMHACGGIPIGNQGRSFKLDPSQVTIAAKPVFSMFSDPTRSFPPHVLVQPFS